MSCKKCNGLDHKTSKSKLCAQYKALLKTLGQKKGVLTETFVIKCGLAKFCIGPERLKVHDRINEIVLRVSLIMIEFSIYLNYHIQSQLSFSIGAFPMPNILRILYAIQGKESKHILEPQYLNFRKKYRIGP